MRFDLLVRSKPGTLRTLNITLAGLLFCVLFVAAQPRTARARASQSGSVSSANSAVPDFSGFWELAADSRHVTPADLTPAAIARDKKAAADRQAGKVIVYASRWCNYMGMPFIMGQSPPINIVQTKDEMAIFSEQNSAPRHIYLGGRTHPSAAQFIPTTNGHSVGRWEGDELVVDTTNFSGKGHPEIPGGGYRGPGSHLVERFKLLPDGQHLQVTFTWDDPGVFLKTHTYYFVYHKMPPDTYAFEDSCDASDAAPYENSGGVSDPPDK
jgi:hypothetical protein